MVANVKVYLGACVICSAAAYFQDRAQEPPQAVQPTAGVNTHSPPASTERDSFELLADSIDAASRAMQQVPGYTATLQRQEQIDGTLREPEEIRLKVRQQPFSVYMKWPARGQEVLYVQGENDGQLLVRRRSLSLFGGVLRLSPESPLALRDSRHAVTQVGIGNLTQQLADFYAKRPNAPRLAARCQHKKVLVENRPGREFVVTFDCPEKGFEKCFSRSKIVFDLTSKLPVSVENYGWTKQGQAGELVEKYTYLNVKPVREFDDREFQEENPEYSFVAAR